MASVYHVFAEQIEYEPCEVWIHDRDQYVLFGRIVFWPASEQQPQHWLCLNREWVVDGKNEYYDGPVIIAITGAEATAGFIDAELGRRRLRFFLDADTASRLDDDELVVEFDLDDREFAILRSQLTEMFDGLTVLRVTE